MEKTRKKFLKLPSLDGGKEQLRKFLRENLRYPELALKNRVEGDVIIRFKVTGKGEVLEPVVLNGPGYGCEEEALRLLSMIRYTSVTNRGVRVTTSNKIRIPFRLPKKKPASTSVKIHYKQNPEKMGETTSPPKAPATGRTYTYTVRLSD